MSDIVALAKKKPGTITVGTPPAPTLIISAPSNSRA